MNHFSKHYKGREYVFEFVQNDFWRVSYQDHETLISCVMHEDDKGNWIMRGNRLSDVVLQPQFNEWIKQHYKKSSELTS